MNEQRKTRSDKVWQQRELATRFLEGIRGGVPLAAEQIDVLHRVVDGCGIPIVKILDLGCGDGILGLSLLERHPRAQAVFVDFSETMLAAAKQRSQSDSLRCHFLNADYGERCWVESVSDHRPFDLVVSGFSIHHQPDERKAALYGEIFELLAPGGVFLNLEHVSSQSKWGEAAFDNLMIDSLWDYHRQRQSKHSREQVADEYVNRTDWSANILASVEEQCRWLCEIGFTDVDCYFKILELALFGGRKALPANSVHQKRE